MQGWCQFGYIAADYDFLAIVMLGNDGDWHRGRAADGNSLQPPLWIPVEIHLFIAMAFRPQPAFDGNAGGTSTCGKYCYFFDHYDPRLFNF